ncbi:F-box protein SKIP19-like [Raphanus sativus]|uniref:F-box protein SKIP19-like n=1 Tax=Raphanus sativus TaxID=3726 RepID=A0A6J0L337_RAPSA|nr:F-box protein SKIP19-like [Raphanus sativus]
MASSSVSQLISWAELPPELISSIVLRLNSIELMEIKLRKYVDRGAASVKTPRCGGRLTCYNNGDLGSIGFDLEIMCRHAVDRSQGGLLETDIWYFGTDELLNYIADRSSNLKKPL